MNAAARFASPRARDKLRGSAGRRSAEGQDLRARQPGRRHRRHVARWWRRPARRRLKLGRRGGGAGLGTHRTAACAGRRIPQRLAYAQPGVRLPARPRLRPRHGQRAARSDGRGRPARRRARQGADRRRRRGRRCGGLARDGVPRRVPLLPARHRRRVRRRCRRRTRAGAGRGHPGGRLRLAARPGQRDHAGASGRQPHHSRAGRLQRPLGAACLRAGTARVLADPQCFRRRVRLPAAVRGRLGPCAGARCAGANVPDQRRRATSPILPAVPRMRASRAPRPCSGPTVSPPRTWIRSW